MKAKFLMFGSCVEAIIFLLLDNLHDYTFNQYILESRKFVHDMTRRNIIKKTYHYY